MAKEAGNVSGRHYVLSVGEGARHQWRAILYGCRNRPG